MSMIKSVSMKFAAFICLLSGTFVLQGPLAFAVLQSSDKPDKLSANAARNQTSKEIIPAYDGNTLNSNAVSVLTSLPTPSIASTVPKDQGDPYTFGYKKTTPSSILKPDFISTSIRKAPISPRAGININKAGNKNDAPTKISYTLSEIEAQNK